MLPKTPAFWDQNGILAILLTPISWFYHLVHLLRLFWQKPYNSNIPVLCVGGVVAGGSGKTPTVHALLELIRADDLFVNPVILTRGYGGDINGPSLVDVHKHTFRDVGDEALLHALHAPTIVSKNRETGARLAEAMGADLIILDDGLQNNTLKKDLSLLVVDGRQGIGNGHLIPAGPLREPLKSALSKCAAVVQTGGMTDLKMPRPTFNTRLEITSMHDTDAEYLAFAGLGRPEKFQETLLGNGLNVTEFISFPDHHPYADLIMKNLFEKAGNRKIITTKKDYMRIPPHYRAGIETLNIRLQFYDPSGVTKLIQGLCRV